MRDEVDPQPGRGPRSPAAIEGRRKLILEQVVRAGSAQVEELASRFGVSRMTIHRDLDALTDRGMVRKQHGGVTLHSSSLVDASFSYRVEIAGRQKSAIARAAAALIAPGQSVILDESTTALAMVPHLAARSPLTVITNGIAMIDALKEMQGVQLIALGGTHIPRVNGFFGLLCENAIAAIRANLFFMSTSAVLHGIAYHQDEEVLKIKRALMGIAQTRVLMVDSSKFGVTALNRLAGLDAFDAVITDDGLPEHERSALRERGIRLTVVEC